MQQPDDWRISYVNKDFSVCPSYPSAVVVPKCIDDDVLTAAATFRIGGRFPVLAYRHEGGVNNYPSTYLTTISSKPVNAFRQS